MDDTDLVPLTISSNDTSIFNIYQNDSSHLAEMIAKAGARIDTKESGKALYVKISILGAEYSKEIP